MSQSNFKKIFLMLAFLSVQFQLSAQHLKISPNKKYLVQADGSPFFYLGDTAWELFHRLSLGEAKIYLEDRASKGFTVIQAVLLAQLGGLTTPNANGDLPLTNGNPSRPVEAYFKHVDAIVKIATDLGLTIGMLPTWGSYWSTINGDEKIFNAINAKTYGQYLGKRYREKQIIWIMGGDENINNPEEREIIEAMAMGIKEEDQSNLMTFHPRGPGRSSDYFHAADWLDFNMFQSSHASHHHDNGLYVEHDLQLQPTKPTLDGEPRYELIPVGFYFKGANQLDLFTDYDCRKASYWSIFAGACGHTYGHNSIWQMYDAPHKPVIGAQIPWHRAIHHPGSHQMGYLRNLVDARPFHKWQPAPQIIVNVKDIGSQIRAIMAEDSSFAMIYSPQGTAFTVDQSTINAQSLKSIWYNPRYGTSFVVHSGNTFGIQTYQPPTSGHENDWILILEDADLNLKLP